MITRSATRSRHLQRAVRLDDLPLAMICLAGGLAWAAISVAFARAAGIPFDPRPLTHVVVALLLALTTIPTIIGCAERHAVASIPVSKRYGE